MLLLLFIGCSSPQRGAEASRPDADAGPQPGRWLPAAQWAPENHQALEGWLDQVASRADEPSKVAVFDWDNTCVYGDVGLVTLRHQLDRLELRMTPEELGAFLVEEVAGVGAPEGGPAFADLRADLLAAYEELYPLIQAGEIEAARALPAHQDFRAKAGWLADALEGVEPTYFLSWLVGWLAGYRAEEVLPLVRRALEAASARQVERVSWASATPGRAGRLEHSFTEGVCPHQELRDLMAALGRAGVRVFVVSASGELIVEAAATFFGFPLEAEAIFGIRTEQSGDLLTTRPVPAERYPITYRQGKVELIRREIDVEPIFAAGDADTDFEMLTLFSGLEVRLILNRNKQDQAIGALYPLAYAPPAEGAPLTLLQGRDEGRCALQPLRETTALGESVPRPVSP